jgi:hypothetical protein
MPEQSFRGYRILKESDTEALEKAVVALIHEGWEPWGSLWVNPPANAAGITQAAKKSYYVQAMVLRGAVRGDG